MLNAYLHSQSWKFGYRPGMGCLWDQPPIKTLGAESLTSFLSFGNISDMLSQFIPCDCTGRILWKFAPGFPQTSHQASSPVAGYALYPSVVINHRVYKYTWSPASFLVNYQTWGWSWNCQYLLLLLVRARWQSHNRVKNTDNTIKSDMIILSLFDPLIEHFHVIFFPLS